MSELRNKIANQNQVWNLLTATQQSVSVTQLATHKAEREVIKGKRKGNKLKRLDLSEAQLTALQAFKTSAKANTQETRVKLKTYRKSERALIQGSEFNTEAWQTLNSECQVDFLTIAVLKAKTKYDIWNLLTTKQQAQVGKGMKIKATKNKHGKKGKKYLHQESI